MAPLVAESLFWVAAATCGVAQVAILRGVVAGRAEPPDSSAATVIERQGVVGRMRRLTEAAWALLPGIALVFVLVWTWHAIHPAGDPSPPTDNPSLLAPAPRA
jgi:hypothetical protein